MKSYKILWLIGCSAVLSGCAINYSEFEPFTSDVLKDKLESVL